MYNSISFVMKKTYENIQVLKQHKECRYIEGVFFQNNSGYSYCGPGITEYTAFFSATERMQFCLFPGA